MAKSPSKKTPAAVSVRCAGPSCEVDFEPVRSTAKYHSATCRQRAARDRKAAKESVEADAEAGKAEHALVRAVRKDLAAAKALDTVAGQLALAAARRIANPDEAGFAAMSKELRALLAEAKGSADPAPAEPPPPADDDDEVKKARRRREEIAAAAAEAEA
jgi:hypothetical protein